uniref:Uncharacterized protein n=1 Tax=Avena sativa TaxID=4498 RepID=A0ACD5Z3P7_AVESA
MGCWYPLREIVSKALGKCNGHERWREEDQRMNYAMAYPPGPPTETHYVRPGARTVTFSGANSVQMIPPNPQGPQQQAPEPQHQAPPPQHQPDHQHQPEPPAPEQGAPPQAEQPRQPKRGKKNPPRRVRFGPDQQPPQQQQQQQDQQQQQHPEHAPGQQQQQQQQLEHAPPGHQGHGPHGPTPGPQHQGPHGPPGYFRYTPSPLPRWEATPRRHEYFSGEYRYSYPTPVREGIYSMATDANRLTTIFSEENPNACVIA